MLFLSCSYIVFGLYFIAFKLLLYTCVLLLYCYCVVVVLLLCFVVSMLSLCIVTFVVLVLLLSCIVLFCVIHRLSLGCSYIVPLVFQCCSRVVHVLYLCVVPKLFPSCSCGWFTSLLLLLCL